MKRETTHTEEQSISYTEIVKHIKQHENKSKLRQLQSAIETDQIGTIYMYAKDGIKFIIKRYRTGRFIKQVWQ